MSQDDLPEARKTLMKLYTDHTLQFTGFGIGVLVALAQELVGHADISRLFVPIFHVPLFLPVFFSTLVLAGYTFFKSAFWGRMNLVAVKTVFGSQEEGVVAKYELVEYKGEPIMGMMFVFHKDEVKKRMEISFHSKRLGKLVYCIMVADYQWLLVSLIIVFIVGIGLAYIP